MSVERPTSPPGRTRVCPHCKSVILESANVCPACHHHLRFGPQAAERRGVQRYSAFRVAGTLRQTADISPCEYTVVISVRNAQGNEIKRHVIDVGAMDRDDQRTF